MASDLYTVKYAEVDGLHFFTGHTPVTKGLCVANSDLKTAFNEVTVQLNKLLKHNCAYAGEAKPTLSYLEFSKLVKDWHTAKSPAFKPSAELQWAKGEAA